MSLLKFSLPKNIAEKCIPGHILSSNTSIVLAPEFDQNEDFVCAEVVLRKNSRHLRLSPECSIIPENTKLIIDYVSSDLIRLSTKPTPNKKDNEGDKEVLPKVDTDKMLRGAVRKLRHSADTMSYTLDVPIKPTKEDITDPIHLFAVHTVHDPKTDTYKLMWGTPNLNHLDTKPWKKMNILFHEHKDSGKEVPHDVRDRILHLIKGDKNLKNYTYHYINLGHDADNKEGRDSYSQGLSLKSYPKYATDEDKLNKNRHTYNTPSNEEIFKQSAKIIALDHVIKSMSKNEELNLDNIETQAWKHYLRKFNYRGETNLNKAINNVPSTLKQNNRKIVNDVLNQLVEDSKKYAGNIKEFKNKNIVLPHYDFPHHTRASDYWRYHYAKASSDKKIDTAFHYITDLMSDAEHNGKNQSKLEHVFDALSDRIPHLHEKYQSSINNLQEAEASLKGVQGLGNKEHLEIALKTYDRARKLHDSMLQKYGDMLGMYGYLLTGIRQGKNEVSNKKIKEKEDSEDVNDEDDSEDGILKKGITELSPEDVTFSTDKDNDTTLRFIAKGNQKVRYDLSNPNFARFLKNRVDQINKRREFLGNESLITPETLKHIEATPGLKETITDSLDYLKSKGIHRSDLRIMPGDENTPKRVFSDKSNDPKETLHDLGQSLNLQHDGLGTHLLRKLYGNMVATMYGSKAGHDIGINDKLISDDHIDKLKELFTKVLNIDTEDVKPENIELLLHILPKIGLYGSQYKKIGDSFRDFIHEKARAAYEVLDRSSSALRNTVGSINNYLLPNLVEESLNHGLSQAIYHRLVKGKRRSTEEFLDSYIDPKGHIKYNHDKSI